MLHMQRLDSNSLLQFSCNEHEQIRCGRPVQDIHSIPLISYSKEGDVVKFSDDGQMPGCQGATINPSH